MGGEEQGWEGGFAGNFMVAIGVLIIFLCGGCTLAFSLPMLIQAISSGSAKGLGYLMVPLIVGGLPTLIGVMMVRAGLRRRLRPKDHPTTKTFD